MGWLFYTDQRIKTYADERDEITRLCTYEDGHGRRCVLLKASKVGSVWYTAARISNDDGSPVESRTYINAEDGSIVFGAVFLTRYDQGCWGFKDMEETMGPCESRAPTSILSLLSQIKDPESYAHEWRKRCNAWASIPTYAEGDKIRLANPVELTDGTFCQIVEATHYRRGNRNLRCYRIVEGGGLVRLSKESFVGSELIEPAAAKGSPVLAEFLSK